MGWLQQDAGCRGWVGKKIEDRRGRKKGFGSRRRRSKIPDLPALFAGEAQAKTRTSRTSRVDGGWRESAMGAADPAQRCSLALTFGDLFFHETDATQF